MNLEEPFQFGDRVQYRIDNSSGVGLMIGYPRYSKNRSVIVLADEAFHGLPINIKWCKRLRHPNIKEAERLRERYDTLYPTFLQER